MKNEYKQEIKRNNNNTKQITYTAKKHFQRLKSPLHWWTPVPSAPPWWAPVPSAPPWWAPVPSALPWWAPVPSSLPWLPALPWSPATPLPRGPDTASISSANLHAFAKICALTYPVYYVCDPEVERVQKYSTQVKVPLHS